MSPESASILCIEYRYANLISKHELFNLRGYMEHSWKTQKYIEALIRDGEAFNRQEWLKEVNATTSEVEKCRAPTPMGAHPVPRPAVDMKEEPRQALLQSMP